MANDTSIVAAQPLRGLLTNVQRFSIHDGPGIRTTVFYKGCPLRCFWCHNPETWRLAPEIQLFPQRCIGCGVCFGRCPQHAHVLLPAPAEEGEHGTGEGGSPPSGPSAPKTQRAFRRELCQGCGRCAETCYAESIVLTGKWWTPEDLLGELVRDREFYVQSGGGVTLSGGEPLMQQPFTRRVLQLCRESGLDTAIETSAYCRWSELAEILPWLDLLIMDIKLIDDGAHRAATGVSNRRILQNARHLGETGVPLIVRTPLIPTVNDTPEAIGAIAAFVRSLPNLLYYELMPFHRLAGSKFASLGLEYRAANLQSPERPQLEALAETARRCGVADVRVG
jgi:pyruvate formate lyase activating enzyme